MLQINNIIEMFRSQRFHMRGLQKWNARDQRNIRRIFFLVLFRRDRDYLLLIVCFSHSAEIISFVNCVKCIYGFAENEMWVERRVTVWWLCSIKFDKV